MELAPGIRRLGPGVANSYLIEEAGEITIIDTGMPSDLKVLQAELAGMGRSIADIRAVVLTHGHSDHIGYAEPIRRDHGVKIEIHELDAALARGEVPNPSKGFGSFRIGSLLGFLWYGARRGMLRIKPIAEVSTFGDGATLDLPGAPRVIHLPGHTPGSAALHVAGRDALFIGDAMATLNVLTGATGPMISPFTADADQALASLARLDGVQAAFVLPGHGEPWRDGLTEAVASIRAEAAAAGRDRAAA